MNIDFLNIRGLDYLSIIDETIKNIRLEYAGLNEQGACKLYSKLLADRLSSKHIPFRLMNISDYGIPFDHAFVTVPYEGADIVCDLTYSQFHCMNPEFADLLLNGFQVMDKEAFRGYISVFSGEKEIAPQKSK